MIITTAADFKQTSFILLHINAGANGEVDDDKNFDTNVTFSVVRPKEDQSVVIVMDISGSMVSVMAAFI